MSPTLADIRLRALPRFGTQDGQPVCLRKAAIFQGGRPCACRPLILTRIFLVGLDPDTGVDFDLRDCHALDLDLRQYPLPHTELFIRHGGFADRATDQEWNETEVAGYDRVLFDAVDEGNIPFDRKGHLTTDGPGADIELVEGWGRSILRHLDASRTRSLRFLPKGPRGW